jgi:hypothetical protein
LLLEDLIAGASDETVSTTNLLRKVIVVSHRMQATEIQRWADSELNGYQEALLPSYRGPLSVPVRGVYSGQFGARDSQSLSSLGVPNPSFVERQFRVNLSQPLAGLEAAAAAEGELAIPWSGHDVVQWNRWEDDMKVPRIEQMSLFSANRVITQMILRGVVDAVRNKALIFALDLQAKYPNAGEQDGPTVAQPEVRSIVTNVTNHIYGDGVNVAVGNRNVQTATVQQGDLPALMEALRDLGLVGVDLTEFEEMVCSDDDDATKVSKVAAFAERIRSGSIALAGGVASNVAADGVLEVAQLFLG